MSPAKPALLRCAIYTRKSSEEGLEQDFNSLHAQREACEAFIKSQRGEGWKAIATAYDDGGVSGGTMERPGLQRLLDDVDAGKIDVIVVYKVDRLTRSLMDFSKIVERLDAKSVSFVAVTQQFNTTSSMGRLTLNILLSFAQFEREVTGERIRDKIAASKRKGMWMGGMVPLGYDVKDRKLVVNENEAETVREIFRLYQELGCVRRLKHELDRCNIKSKRRISKAGETSGGISIGRGALYDLLSNPIYVGLIKHRDVTYPGQHAAIIEPDLWDAVQKQLNLSRVDRRAHQADPSPLLGKLYASTGERLIPHHANKAGRRYRYYVAPHLLTGEGHSTDSGWRVPASELEKTVQALVKATLSDRSAILRAARDAGMTVTDIPAMLDCGRALADDLGKTTAFPDYLIDRVELSPDGITLDLSLPSAASENADSVAVTTHHPMQIRRRGEEMRLVIDGPGPVIRPVDVPLLKAIARGYRWFDELAAGQIETVNAIASREGITRRYVSRLIRLALLAPEIVEAIATGTQPVELIAETLTYLELPVEWAAQKACLGFPQ